MRERAFKTEADLCAAFIAWAKPQGVECYAEWWGWDILVVYPDGMQLGIQAKLRLNAEVLIQAAPDFFDYIPDQQGPDYRAVLVPDASRPFAKIADRLGVVTFTAHERGYPTSRIEFAPTLDGRSFSGHYYGEPWVDWCPGKRHDLPPVQTDAIAGSPCPVTLTHWKIGAIAVLAELAVKGAITTKRMREIGVNPSRWLSACWLTPGETRGYWVRGERCPKFDEQHPTAYAAALEKARIALEKSA